MKLLSQSAKDD